MHAELVALQFPPGPDLVAAIEQVWSSGGAVLPLPAGAPDAFVERVLHDLRPAAIAQPRAAEQGGAALHRLPGGQPVNPGTALVALTSGTGGDVKGVELTHAALTASVQGSLSRLGARKGDRWLCCLPLHHVAGLLTVLRSQRLDAEPIIHDRFDVAAIAGETRARFVSLVPTMLHRLLEADVDLSRYEAVLLGGAPASATLRERAAAAGVNVVTAYGMTETTGGCVYDGEPLPGVEVELDDHGRIRVRGRVVMRGYRGRPDLTGRAFHDGWLLTGDLGRWDDDGRLAVLGRLDDVIITGGENVVGSIVADILADDPRVAEAAVVGRPDDEWGQIVAAVVVPADPAAPPSLEDLREAAGERLPAYALPKELWTVESLPRDRMGKISRPALRAFVSRR